MMSLILIGRRGLSPESELPIGPPPASGSGFNIFRDFNSGTVGTAANRTADGFDDVAGDSLYTTEQVYEGSQACKLSIASGATGWGKWGGAILFPEIVEKGRDLWIDLHVRMPASFIIETPGNGSLKYLRVRQRTAAGALTGYFDLQFQDDDKTISEFRMLKEGQAVWQNFGTNGVFTREVWHRHTLHMHLDDVLPASGGTSRIRFWQNGALQVDSATIKTILNPTDYADGLYLFTYWNGGAPQDQSLYVDQIRVSTDTVPSWATGLAGVP
jgi:hypothetical protein